MSQVKDLVDAIDAFIVGCKDDAIWDAIKACCIMAAWDGLTAIEVPLKGAAPTNNNFVSGDYNRKTGLVGDGATKYLDSNRNNNADPQNDNHNAVFVSTIGTGALLGPLSSTLTGDNTLSTAATRSRNFTADLYTLALTGFVGTARSGSSSYVRRTGNASSTITRTSQIPGSTDITILRFNFGTPEYGSSRISFYSIGEALDLALLDSRVSTLMTAIGAAIP